ncbi:pyridoxamine 5'-phosphate oxidase family protein [Kitasatospora purpeofusca]|uniref:Pyridoxamine 5'-phosphate oxidase family protein n=1 Tax=Kitasatospora purpeofusca TaxID=67352 RepID=A0ABZ1UD72_9ACTN|nr:pyridoxamine 5'-phosphate oxidase family protein [Kitasatospora purpeofusca]
MSFSMTRAECERFLAGVHVGVLSVAGAEPDGAPLSVPIWYSYRPGGLVTVLTGRESVKTRRIRAARRFTLCAQQEETPCRYVSVSGPVVAIEDGIDPAERAALAHHYLPPATAAAYLVATAEQLTADVTVRMRPERWLSADFAAIAEQLRNAPPTAAERISPRPSDPAGPA